MHVPECHDAWHVRVLTGHVAVEQERSAPEEFEEVIGKLAELLLGTMRALLDPGGVIFPQCGAHMLPARLACQEHGVDDLLSVGHAVGELAEPLDTSFRLSAGFDLGLVLPLGGVAAGCLAA